ncbi:MAG: hypothetical protein KHZ67_11490, partial [Clostridiales bacterium]|nr:hypothetical protein [Clostridiales bacterium]
SQSGFLRNLQGWLYCSIIKVLCDFFFAVSATAHIIYHSRLRLSSTFSTFFQFIVFNNFELFLLLLQFSLLFLNCFCCVCVVFSDVDYNTTLQRVCQQVFSFFCSLKAAKK